MIVDSARIGSGKLLLTEYTIGISVITMPNIFREIHVLYAVDTCPSKRTGNLSQEHRLHYKLRCELRNTLRLCDLPERLFS